MAGRLIKACAALLLAQSAGSAWGADGSAAAPLPELDAVAALARQAMETTGANGLAIAIVDEGQLKHVAAFGLRNARGHPLTPDTIMYAASLTKAVFGYYAAMLVDDGTLELDHPIAAMLPQPLPSYGNIDAYGHWGDLADDPRWSAITPRMVLNRSTGFANFAFLEPDGRLRFHFDPGTRYAYSGEGMMLLQFGLEQGQGRNVGADIDARLFKPLGMTRTSLMWRADFSENMADGWAADGAVEAHDERSRVRVAGSMDSSITDMGRIAAAMVSGFGLSRRAHAEFTRPTLALTTRSQFPTLQADVSEAERPAAAAAMGVITFNGPQGPGFYKGGHNDTTGNIMVCLNERQRCVVVMANDVRAEAAFPGLVRAILGDTGVPWTWEYGPAVQP